MTNPKKEASKKPVKKKPAPRKKKEDDMGAPKGNKYTQKRPRPMVLKILSDIIKGMMEYQVYEEQYKEGAYSKEEGGGSERVHKKRIHEGYNSLSSACIANGITRGTLWHWKNTTYKDDEEVCDTISFLKDLNIDHTFKLAADGTYSARIGAFLLNTICGMTESSKTDITTQGEKINSGAVMITMEDAKKKLEELDSDI